MGGGQNDPGGQAGAATDSFGRAVLDPTANVLDLVAAAITRQDDLREAEAQRVNELATLRAFYEGELRKAESARIDAIRAVDTGAVSRAAEVSATQASTLAAQVATSAETLRTQVAAAATAASVALSAALEPIQKDIADLRRVQYEQQGQKAGAVETKRDTSDGRLYLVGAIAALSPFITIAIGAATHGKF
jgi:hypothetical protein